MSETSIAETQETLQEGMAGVVSDFSSDKQSFHVHWGKAMMWIFLLSDTFIFSADLAIQQQGRISSSSIKAKGSVVYSTSPSISFVRQAPQKPSRQW